MKESDYQNQDAPLSYRGARHIVGLVFLLVIAWFVLRSLQPVVFGDGTGAPTRFSAIMSSKVNGCFTFPDALGDGV